MQRTQNSKANIHVPKGKDAILVTEVGKKS